LHSFGASHPNCEEEDAVMDFNKLKDSPSEEDKKKISEKAEEIEQGISNRVDREMEPRDQRTNQEKEIASSDVHPDDTSEKNEETDEERAA
jgi:hypothetical protein